MVLANLPVLLLWMSVLWAVLHGAIAYFRVRRWQYVSAQSREAGADGNEAVAILRLNSQPMYHACYVALWVVIPTLLLFLLWRVCEHSVLTVLLEQQLPSVWREAAQRDATILAQLMDRIDSVSSMVPSLRERYIGSVADGAFLQQATTQWWALMAGSTRLLSAAMLAVMLVTALQAQRMISPAFTARTAVENTLKRTMQLSSLLAIAVTIAIVLSVIVEAIQFFQLVPIQEFLFGTHWSPQTAMRADQAGSSGSFGAIPLFAGTLLITVIAMLVAVPVGLMAAIYMSEYASQRVRNLAKPMLEILAGIPTVVYGYFAAITVAPFIRDTGGLLGLDVASESALAAGLVMGVMIIPFVSSLSDDVINAVPQALRDASYGLGATQSETIRKVILPAATPGIVGAVLLAVSRAIGETMIVVMAAGLAANLTLNPLDSVTTITAQIVSLLVGDQEFDSAKTLAAFALGLTLFVITLLLNIYALRVVRQYRERYS